MEYVPINMLVCDRMSHLNTFWSIKNSNITCPRIFGLMVYLIYKWQIISPTLVVVYKLSFNDSYTITNLYFACRYLNTTRYTGGFTRPELNAFFNQIYTNFSSWISNFAPLAIGANSTTAIEELEGSLRRMKPEIALSAAETVLLSDLRRILPKVMVPTSIIQSKKDMVVPESVAFYMKRRLGAPAKVTILDTQGHFPQLTVYPLLLKVLRGVLHIK